MSNKLKALLLCAGFGTRLRPLTLNTPKCLMPISGKPLLGIWLEKLEKNGFDEVLINTHYLADQVNTYLKKENKNYRMKITTVFEEKLLGTAATLMENRYFFEDSTGFLIHGDNLTDFNLSELLKAHLNKKKKCLLTMLTFNSNKPEQCGIVETDKDGVLIGFHEKVKNPPSKKANAAIYVFDYDLLNFIANLKIRKIDFSKDIIPNLLGLIQTHHTNDILIDIGTKTSLKDANNFWPRLL